MSQAFEITFFWFAVKIACDSGTIISPGWMPNCSASILLVKPPSKMISETDGSEGELWLPLKKWGGTEPDIIGIAFPSWV